MKLLIIILFYSSVIFAQIKNETILLAQKYHNTFNNNVHKPSDSSKTALILLKQLADNHKLPLLITWYYQDVGYLFFTKGKNKESIKNYQRSLDIAVKNDFLKEIIVCKNWIANNYVLINDNKKAIKYYSDILMLAKKSHSINAYITAWTGLANDSSITIKEQLEYKLKLDSICSINNIETAELSNAYNWIGSTYLNHFKNEKLAIKYYNKSLKIAYKVNYIPGIQYVTMLLSDMALSHNEFDKVKKYYSDLITKYRDYDSLFVAKTYRELTNVADLEKKYLKAIEHIDKSTTIFKKLKDTNNLNYNKLIKAKINLKTNNFKDVKKSVDDLDKINAKNIFFLKNLYQIKSDYYTKTNHFKKALFYYKKLDSITKINAEKSNYNKFAELEQKYHSNKKEQEKALLRTKNELIISQKRNQKIILFSVIGITSAIGLFFFFQFKNRKKTTKKLLELDKAKSIFFTNISHEFRTPLTLISGPIQQLLKKENVLLDEKESLKMMQRNTNRLLSLVDQLLDISKMASGNLNLRVSENNIISFVGNLLDGFHFMSKQKELNYIINIKPTKTNTWFDKDFLEKIILNLVSNAIKYTPKKGSVVCNAIVVDNYFHFEIKNSGKGITKQELQKIFNRFYQTDEYQQGTGIGLSLAKNLVELHKGIITVESELEGWTTFKIKIPINKKYFKDFEISQNITNKDLTNKIIEGHTNNYKNKLENNEKPILLLVEDNTEVRTYLSSIFKNTYQILQVKNGKEGINLALEIVPDIIISDIMMPIINGIELCNKLKTEEITSHIPIILLTAKAGDENKLKGIKTRADDYITKPFNEELLKFKIANLLEIRKKLQIRFSQEVILKPFDVAINTADQMFLEKLQMILDKQLIESDFNSEKFCKAVGVSRMQLHRKLKALFNMSTSQFIRTQRLKLAADLLKKSDINISQIGYSVGFNDHAYFSKCFKKMFGCSPLEYSKKK